MLFSATVTGSKPKAIVFNHISRACMHARMTSDMYVERCKKKQDRGGRRKKMREARKSRCTGTREKAFDRKAEVTRTIERSGVEARQGILCVF